MVQWGVRQISIEIQLMQTFIDDMCVRSIAQIDVPQVHQSLFENLSTNVINTSTETLFSQQISFFN